MSQSFLIDNNRVPASRRTNRLFLSLFYEDARDLVTWMDFAPPPFRMRALFYSGFETVVIIQFIGERGDVVNDVTPQQPNGIPNGLEPLVLALTARADALFQTTTKVEFVSYEAEGHLHPKEAIPMVPEGKLPLWGVKEVEASFPQHIAIRSISNHRLMQITDLPELEYYNGAAG